jgi:hypothetical protein
MADRYSEDFTINHFSRINDDYTKTVDQVPFFLNMKGPATLKKRAQAYVATTNNPDKVVS